MTDPPTPDEINRLAKCIRRTREQYRTLPVMLAELRTHGVSWDSIEEMTGIPSATAHRWVTRLLSASPAGSPIPTPEVCNTSNSSSTTPG